MQDMNLGELADHLKMLKDQRTELNSQVKSLNKDIDAVEQQLIEGCNRIGTDILRGSLVTVTISDSNLPSVDDWDAFYDYIIDNNAPYLLHRRVSATAMQEIWNAGQEVPGVEPIPVKVVRTKSK